MSDLPSGWTATGLLEISELVRGVTYTKVDARNVAFDGSIPVIRANNIQDRAFDLADLVYVPSSAVSGTQRITKGDVVVATSSGSISVVGKAAQASSNMNAGFGAFCGLLRPSRGIDARYFGHYFSSHAYRTTVSAMARGVNINNLKRGHFEALELPLAPLSEQKRIADKLDAVLARVDVCRDRLDRIPAILKRFRQSVLAAATSGKLTEEWRAERAADMEPQHESASVACDSGRLAYRVTSRCPDGWRDVRLADIADVQGGVTKDAKKQSSEDEEVPYLRVANVQRGYLDLSEIKSIRVPAGRLAGLLLESGDILFNEGGDIDKVGRGWIWEGQIERCSFQNHVFRARLYDKTNQPKYISWWGNFRGLDYFLRSGKQTTNLASINKSMLSNLPISLPPPEEQTEIVRRVEALFAYADRLEARYAAARARVDKLTPATLAKAFRGELVPQDPNDEPAGALLARIAAARAGAAPARRPPTKSTARKEPFPS